MASVASTICHDAGSSAWVFQSPQTSPHEKPVVPSRLVEFQGEVPSPVPGARGLFGCDWRRRQNQSNADFIAGSRANQTLWA
jgi:hypothetical protein